MDKETLDAHIEWVQRTVTQSEGTEDIREAVNELPDGDLREVLFVLLASYVQDVRYIRGAVAESEKPHVYH
jgi:hypothetical protein